MIWQMVPVAPAKKKDPGLYQVKDPLSIGK